VLSPFSISAIYFLASYDAGQNYGYAVGFDVKNATQGEVKVVQTLLVVYFLEYKSSPVQPYTHLCLFCLIDLLQQIHEAVSMHIHTAF
jgi:hypothetical protein